jgi:outer membrane protein OmpA-like peptidoglycan-associated protein
MRRTSLIIGAALAITGCAGTRVAMFPGEMNALGKQNPTGGLAVLDPVTGKDISLIDQADSRNAIGKRSVSMTQMSAAAMNAKYGSLMSSMPEPPKLFILYFKEGSSDLVDESGAILPDLFAEVKRRPGADVQIVGHTDSVGAEALNDSLSVKRAEQVKAMLGKLGLNGEIVRATGRGERELREETPDETASALNRRVEVFVK